MFDVALLPWPDRKKTGFLVRIGPVSFSHRDLEKCRPRCVAGRPGVGRYLPGYKRIVSGLHCTESGVFRLNLTRPFTAEHPYYSARVCSSPVGQMLSPLGREDVVGGLASPLADDAATQYGYRPDLCQSRSVSNEFRRDRRVDAVSSVRSDSASNDDQFRDEYRLPAAEQPLGKLGRWKVPTIPTGRTSEGSLTTFRQMVASVAQHRWVSALSYLDDFYRQLWDAGRSQPHFCTHPVICRLLPTHCEAARSRFA